MRSLHLLRISLFILVCAIQLSWAQRRAAAPANPNSAPMRNIPDPTGQAHLEYHQYDKTPLSFKSSAIYVLVPAVVTDKNGNHVTGLTVSDFRIQENGKDQKVSSVEEVKPIAEISLTASHRENEFSNQAPSDSKARQLVIIALDMINTPYSDQARARGQLISYLSESVEPGCLYQLVAIEDNGLRVLHDYTQDTGALIAALRQAKSRLSSKNTIDTEGLRRFAPTDVGVTAQSSLEVNPYTGRPDVENMLQFAGERAYAQMKEGLAAQATLSAFQQIAEGVGGIPGRKSLVWITGSFPFSIDPATASVNTGLAFEAYQHTMRLLEQQMISVYPVDARGLLLTQPDASMRLSGSQIARASTLTADLSNRLLDTLETMRAFADMTGGRAYVNTNDTRSAVRDAVRDGSAYYMLTYAADKSNVRPGWRQITVKSRDYHILARRGYFMTQTTIDPSRMAGSDIAIALKSPFTYRGLPLKIVISSPAGTEQQRKVMFSLLVPPKAASVDKDDRNHLHLDIAYAVWNRAGEDAGHKLVDYNLNLDPTQLQQIENQGVGYGDTLGLTPGSYRLRVVVRDDLTGRTGSVQAPLEVK